MNLIKPKNIHAAVGHCFTGRILWRTAAGMSLVLLTGCRCAPSINLVGSFFPGWMLCMALCAIGTLVVRQIFVKNGIDGHLPLRVFIYLCLWVCTTLTSWLFFFRS